MKQILMIWYIISKYWQKISLTFWKNKIWRDEAKGSKKYQKMFKANLNEIIRRRYKWKEQESVLSNIKIVNKTREKVIKLLIGILQ